MQTKILCARPKDSLPLLHTISDKGHPVAHISNHDATKGIRHRVATTWCMLDEEIGFYTTLREALMLRRSGDMPRIRVLNDDFFSYSIGQILGMPRKVVDRKLALVPGAGPKSAMVVVEVIEELREQLCCQKVGSGSAPQKTHQDGMYLRTDT